MKRINDIDGMMEELCNIQTKALPASSGQLVEATSHAHIRAIVSKYVENVPECNTVKEIVTNHLKVIGADGLCNKEQGDCHCILTDCIGVPVCRRDCQPAYRHADGVLRPEKAKINAAMKE